MSQLLVFAALFIGISILMVLRVQADASARIRQERRQFRLALDSSAVERTRFVILGLLPGLLLSAALGFAGVVLPASLGITLTLLSLLLICFRRFFSPLLLATAGLVTVAAPVKWWAMLGITTTNHMAAPFAVLMAFFAIAAVVTECLMPYHASPRLAQEHGRSRARFVLRQLAWVPLLLPIPGDWLAQLPLSPIVSPGTQGVQFILVPLVLGFAFTSRDGQLTRALHRRAWWSGIFAAFALVMAWVAWQQLFPETTVLLALAAGGVLAAGGQWLSARGRGGFTAAAGGVRVVGIQPGTPAERMKLQRGDTILDCNAQPVETARELYVATQHLGTFCRLRVRDLEGRIRLTETAIYAGSPHMLGVITFPEDEA